MLQLLLESAGRVLSRQHFEESLYGWDEEIESNAIEVHIHHLRKKLGSDLIRTVRGVGYTIDKEKVDKGSTACGLVERGDYLLAMSDLKTNQLATAV